MPEVLTQLFSTSVMAFTHKCVATETWGSSHLILYLNAYIWAKLVPKTLSAVNG